MRIDGTVLAVPDNDAPDANEKSWEISGCLLGNRHVLPVRVYFEDTDFSGVVYHASYLRWCERGRSDFLRLLGISHKALAEGANGQPCAFAVKRIEADFIKAARIDEILEVHTGIGDLTKASVTLAQAIMRAAEPIFRLRAQCVLVSPSGRLLRLPQALSSAISGAQGVLDNPEKSMR